MPNRLPDITETNPVGPADAMFVAEVYELLKRYNALDRFGLVLLHDHFPTSTDELLVEVCEPESRTLTTRPMPRSELPEHGRLIETLWAFEEPSSNTLQAKLVCKVGCFVDLKDRHRRVHDRVNG